jgi:hypothetical protein
MTNQDKSDFVDFTPKQKDWIEGLRAMADFAEAHPEMLSEYPMAVSLYCNLPDGDPKEEMARMARTLAPCEKKVTDYGSPSFHLVKRFGPHTYTFFTERENVCVRRVVGTEEVEVEGYTDEAQAIIDAIPRVVKTEEREIVEWDCEPLLSAVS